MAGARHRLLLFTGLMLMLGGCSGTPFGDQLSRSFSNPGAPTSGTAARPTTNPAAPATGTSGQSATRANPTPVQDTKATTPKQAAKTAVATTLQPVPYRVTIKLPAADPSAPAEVVTQALRAAGVSFEVEMIERVPGTAAPAAPVVTPAPAPR